MRYVQEVAGMPWLYCQIGVDTLICGELRQRHYTMAQELRLNLYPCGHYATECFGIMALGELLQRFD
ncbi:MAG: Nif3-like dinuclear metal center hexameric protein [Bacilli bacterium]